MRIPIIFYKWNFCHNCKRETIEIFDYFNNKLKYKELVEKYIRNQHWEITKPIYVMRCTTCGKKYNIRINDDKFPVPMVDNDSVDKFILSYINMEKRKTRKVNLL